MPGWLNVVGNVEQEVKAKNVPCRNRDDGHPTGISMMCSGIFGYFEELQNKVFRKAE